MTSRQAIKEFLLSCKVEGKSYGAIDCYRDKLKGFLWYTTNHDWPNDVSAITTQHLRESLAYLRDTDHRFESNCASMRKVYRQFQTLACVQQSVALLPQV